MVSDAGMPTVSDPGAQLIKVVASKGIKVIPIPGASAFLSALVASGLTHERFTFCGFIESKVTKRRRQLHELRGMIHEQIGTKMTLTLRYRSNNYSLCRISINSNLLCLSTFIKGSNDRCY